MIWKGADWLRPLLVSIDELHEDPRNRRLHSEFNLATIRQSLERFGQQLPVIAKTNGEMVVGSGRLEAMRELLGWTHVARVVFRGNDRLAKKLALIDNRSAELAGWDLEGLAQALRLMQDAGMDLQALGWRDFEAAPLLTAEWQPVEAGSGGSNGSGLQPIRVTHGQRRAFDTAHQAMKEEDNDDMSEGACVIALCQQWLDRH